MTTDTGGIIRGSASSPPRERRAVASSARWVLIGAILLLAVFAYQDLIGWDPGREIARDAPELFEPANTSPLFILGLSALFLYLRLGRLRHAAARPRTSPWGWALLVPALGVYLWGVYTGALDLLLVSLIPFLLGCSLILVGGAFTHVLLLPVLFLIFAYPIPAVIANQQVYAFQLGTASLTTWILNLIGQSAILQGDLIYTRGRIFEVIETCAGLRITETLVASAFAYGELARLRRLHTTIIVILAPAIGFVLNTARVLLIIFTPGSGPASDHTLQGILVLVAGVVSFALIDRILVRVLPAERGPSPATQPPAASPGRPRLAALAGALVVVLGMGAARLWLPIWDPGSGPARWRITMPTQWDGWKAEKARTDETFLGSVFFSRHVHRRYEKDGRWVETFAAKDDRLQRDRSILSAKTALPGSGWAIEERHRNRFGWAPTDVEVIVARRRNERVLIYHWREGSNGFRQEAVRALLALDRSFLRRPTEFRVFRVSTPIEERIDGLDQARERLGKFAPRVRESVELG